MGQRHFDAMLQDAQRRERNILPLVAGLTHADRLLGPLIPDVIRATSVARRMPAIGHEFRDGLVAAIMRGTIWMYRRDSRGIPFRCKDVTVLDDIFD